MNFDSVLLIGFGAPEHEEEIVPFLKALLEGRPIPQARFDQVVENYRLIGGRSPYNALTQKQAEALRRWLQKNQIDIPVFLGMRNWRPYLQDILSQMKQKECANAIAIVLAPHRSPASFDRYVESAEKAKQAVGHENLKINYVPAWHTHPLFIEALSERIQETLTRMGAEKQKRAEFIFTAHSLPVSMAQQCSYEKEIRGTAAAVMKNFSYPWHVAYQSRSGNPADPWLGPDVSELIRERAEAGLKNAVVIPSGFLCDHTEVLYDLDILARKNAESCGVHFERALTVMDHPKFIAMLGSLVRDCFAPSLRAYGPKGPEAGLAMTNAPSLRGGRRPTKQSSDANLSK